MNVVWEIFEINKVLAQFKKFSEPKDIIISRWKVEQIYASSQESFLAFPAGVCFSEGTSRPQNRPQRFPKGAFRTAQAGWERFERDLYEDLVVCDERGPVGAHLPRGD